MSIGADVARIKGNITAALAAIADKGVTVPAGSTSDALSGLIASIEAGGGIPGFGYDIAFGDFTVTAEKTCSALDIFTDLKYVYGAYLWCTEMFTANAQGQNALIQGASLYDATGWTVSSTKYKQVVCFNHKLKTGKLSYSGINLTKSPSSTFVIYASSQYYFPGFTYKWIAWGKKK